MAVEMSDLASFPDATRVTEFQQVYDAYRQRLFRFCFSRLRDAHEAEDVMQEAFARAWRAQLCFSDRERSYAWLRVVAGNLCTDIHRRRGRCQTSPEIEPAPAFGADDPVMRASDTQTVREALRRLNERHRSALREREEVGSTYEQMAAKAGTSVATVESLLWRARQALKREVMALASPEGVLSVVPIAVLVLRRVRLAKAKLSAWESQLAQFLSTPQFLGPATLVVGLCPAFCAVGFAGGGSATGTTAAPIAPAPAVLTAASTTPTTSTTVKSSPPSTARGNPSRSSTDLRSATFVPAAEAAAAVPTHHVIVRNPVSSTQADNQRDRSMPISVSVGPDSVGVDPPALIDPTVNAVAAALPGGKK